MTSLFSWCSYYAIVTELKVCGVRTDLPILTTTKSFLLGLFDLLEDGPSHTYAGTILRVHSNHAVQSVSVVNTAAAVGFRISPENSECQELV